MRERTFRRPSVREVLEINKIDMPKRVTRNYLKELMGEGKIVYAGDTYKEVVKTVDSYLGDPKIVLFPEQFKMTKDETDDKIKSLAGLVKIDSKRVLRELSGQEQVPSRLTQRFAIQYKVLPQELIRLAVQNQDNENPPLGFYWIGSNGSARATTWLRSATASEMEIMRQRGDLGGKILDPQPYGRNIRVEVESRDEDGDSHKIPISRLSLFKEGDLRRFSKWANISHTSSDDDATFMGVAHDKRENPTVFWSVPSIAGFYQTINFLKGRSNEELVRVNPFSIQHERMSSFIDFLRLQSLIIDFKGQVSSLDKEEINKIVGAKTVLEPYEFNWFHSGTKSLDYLYTPES